MTNRGLGLDARTARRIGLTGAIVVAVVVVLLVAPGDNDRAHARTQAKAPVQKIAFSAASSRWKPSDNAKVSTIRSGSRITGVQVKPRRSSGRKNISMRSNLSAKSVTAAGSIVTARARLRTSQPGRTLRFRVQEVRAGKTVTSRSVTVRSSTRGWREVLVTLRTSKPGSRLRLIATASKVRSRNMLRLSSIRVVATPPAPRPPDPPAAAPCQDIDYSDPEQGVLTFADEFSGDTIDRDTWRVRDNTFLNQDQAWITKDAVTVEDGVLRITGRRLPDDQHRTNLNGTYKKDRDYSTGYIDTIDSAGYGNAAGNRFGQKYGHFEVRAWVPSETTMSRGIWPAFWLRADHRLGEIDPLESYGGPTIQNFDPSSSYEWNSWRDTSQVSSKDHTWGRANVGDDKIWQGWHTFGVNWSPGCLRYLYDGRTVGIVDFDDPDTLPYFRGPTFDSTFHLRINMQVGSNYWGWADPQHTRDEFTYRVDWVRVHQGKALLLP